MVKMLNLHSRLSWSAVFPASCEKTIGAVLWADTFSEVRKYTERLVHAEFYTQ